MTIPFAITSACLAAFYRETGYLLIVSFDITLATIVAPLVSNAFVFATCMKICSAYLNHFRRHSVHSSDASIQRLQVLELRFYPSPLVPSLA